MVITSTFSDQTPLTISFYMKEPADKAFSVHFEIVKTAKLTDTEDKYFIWYDLKTYGDEADQ